MEISISAYRDRGGLEKPWQEICWQPFIPRDVILPIRMMAGESVGVNVTRYLNTMDSFGTTDDVLTYLIHLGYLAYDREHKKCRIPNREVRLEWENALLSDKNYETTNRIIAESEDKNATITGAGNQGIKIGENYFTIVVCE